MTLAAAADASAESARAEAEAEYNREYFALINGRLESCSKSFGVINPATGQEFARCPEASGEQVQSVFSCE